MELYERTKIDMAKVQNYVDTRILAPMNIQEQKALCRLVLELTAEYERRYKSGLTVLTEEDYDRHISNAE